MSNANTNTSTLSLDEIDTLLSEAKTRGEYKPVIQNFLEGGDLYLNLSERFPGKVAASLRNAVNIRLKQDFATSNYKLMVVGEPIDKGGNGQAVMLVNMDVHADMKRNAATAATAE